MAPLDDDLGRGSPSNPEYLLPLVRPLGRRQDAGLTHGCVVMNSDRLPDDEDAASAQGAVPPLPEAPDAAVQRGDAHLLPCRRCGMLNGQSAESCWACEANFLVTRPFGARAAPEAPGRGVEPPHRGLHLVEPREVQTSPVEPAVPSRAPQDDVATGVAAAVDPEATVPVPVPQIHVPSSGVDLALPMPRTAEADALLFARSPRRYRLDLIAAVIAVVLMGLGVYLLSGSGSTATVETTTPPPVTIVPPALQDGPATASRTGVAADAPSAAGKAKPERLPVWPPYPCTPPVAATGLCKMEAGAAKD